MDDRIDNEEERLSKARRERVADSMLAALAVLEKAAPALPREAPPPIYYQADFSSGASLPVSTVAPRALSGTTLILKGWDTSAPGSGHAQVQYHKTTMRNGIAYGHLTAIYVFEAKRRPKRMDMDFRWLAPNVFDAKGLSGTWARGQSNDADHLQFAMDAINAMNVHCRTNPMLFLSLDDIAVQIACSSSFARRLLSGRDKAAGSGRRAALRHFVDHYFRDQGTKAGDDEVWVRKHLRGAMECEWGGFTALLRPPETWLEEHDDWVEARDAYRNLPPEDRAAARNLIRTTYGLKPKELNGAMMGD